MPTKTVRAKVSADHEGLVVAIVARPALTLDDARPIVVDYDREIFGPTAIKDGAHLLVSDYGHSVIEGRAPVARATVRLIDGVAVATIQYWPDIPRSWETFLTVKYLADVTEWSVGFRTLRTGTPTEAQRKLGAERVLLDVDLVELSPVARGAQRSTGVVSVRHDPATQAQLEAIRTAWQRRTIEQTVRDRIRRERDIRGHVPDPTLRAIARRWGFAA